jgi:hypothetical protein
MEQYEVLLPDNWKNFQSYHISLISTNWQPNLKSKQYTISPPPTSYNEARLDSKKQNKFS